MFRPEDMKLPDSWGKVDLASVPREIAESIQNNAPTPELRDHEQAQKRIALYYANLAQMDDCLGKVLAALRKLRLQTCLFRTLPRVFCAASNATLS